jgi:L-ascorbate metabolism protein UlaG (beta-lactamase superfamily)
MFFIILILLSIPVIFLLTGVMISAPKYSGPVSDHFDGKKFINPTGIKAKGLSDVLQWMLKRQRAPWKEDTTESYGTRPLSREKETIRITFVNHSTFLIQVDGLNIITDPIWSTRTSPFNWAGPKRMRLPGIRFEDLPRIDVVLLSHNHYDHLDLPTMRMIFGGNHPRIVTPLGVKAFLEQEQIKGATDLDWWDELRLNDHVNVQSVPAQHFSGRGTLDRDATLWCGYVLKTSKGNIYFAGDTGYNDQTFNTIGERFGSMRASLIPIGAYKPQWFMSPIHVSPDQAVQIHKDVKSQVSVGTHFGTFPLADDGADDPKNDLKIALENADLKPDEFITLKEGEVLILD